MPPGRDVTRTLKDMLSSQTSALFLTIFLIDNDGGSGHIYTLMLKLSMLTQLKLILLQRARNNIDMRGL